MSLDSYNSKYPLEYYEIGTCYAFYKYVECSNTRPATNEEISEFSKSLDDCWKENASLMTGGSSAYNHKICRAVGIVIDKGIYDTPKQKKYLVVMFIGEKNSHFVTKYILDDEWPVFLDNHESVTPGRVVSEKRRDDVTEVRKNSRVNNSGSGATEVKESGATEVKENGATEVKVSGPTKA